MKKHSMKEEILRLDRVEKNHIECHLFNINLQLYKNEVHALMMRSGAELKMLMDILTLKDKPDRGYFYFEDRKISIDSGGAQIKNRIYHIPQRSHLFPLQSIAENIFVLYETKSMWKFINHKKIYKRTSAILQHYGLNDIQPNVLPLYLPASICHMIEVIKAIVHGCKVLLIDNITSLYTDQEEEAFSRFLRKIAREGISVLFVTSKYQRLLNDTDRITIIRQGTTVGYTNINDTDKESLMTVLAGYPLDNIISSPVTEHAEKILDVKALGNSSLLDNLCFTLYQNEVFGILSTDAESGYELSNILCRDEPYSGSIELVDTKTNSNKIGLVTSSDLGTSIFLNFNLIQNITLTMQPISKFPLHIINKRVEKYLYQKSLHEIHSEDIRTVLESFQTIPGIVNNETKMRIQIAKWICANASVIVMLNPNTDFDDIDNSVLKQMVGDICEAGISVIIISSSLQFLLNICRRVGVLEDGRISKVIEQ